MEILYSDSQIAVCVKEPGLLSQDSGARCVPQLLRQQLGVEAVWPVHRLDREAGGVMVYALTADAAAVLSRAVQQRQLEKIYQAVLCGAPEQPCAVLEDLLFHDKQKNKTYVVKRERKGVKPARLSYQVLAQAEGLTLVQVQLDTGRTHQIRVQFASRQLPLASDGKYGGRKAEGGLALWSYQLSFPHPGTGKRMTFVAQPPPNTPWNSFNSAKKTEKKK